MFSSSNFLDTYLSSDKVLKLKTSNGTQAGGFNVCQYVKSATELKELWIITSLGKIVLTFTSEGEAKVAHNALNQAIETLIPNCQVSVPPIVGTYIHVQSIAASVWTINHNLGTFPSVTVVDTNDEVFIGDVVYNSASTITITFTSAYAGKAFLN